MLQVKNLTKKYQKFLALDNINFTLKKGEILGLVGDNGAGKTTLINCILGNIKTVSGQIFLNKIEIKKNHKDCLKIIFIPDLMGVTIDLTIKEYVSYLAILKKKIRKKALAKLVMALNELGFEKDLVNKKISNLSAGQKKKVFCAMLLSLSLDLLILDEPTANLDVKTKEEFIEIIKLLNSKGVTILITSHIIEELQQIINHLVIINNKKIVYDQKFDKNKQTIKAIYDQFVERKMQDLNKIKDIISF